MLLWTCMISPSTLYPLLPSSRCPLLTACWSCHGCSGLPEAASVDNRSPWSGSAPQRALWGPVSVFQGEKVRQKRPGGGGLGQEQPSQLPEVSRRWFRPRTRVIKGCLADHQTGQSITPTTNALHCPGRSVLQPEAAVNGRWRANKSWTTPGDGNYFGCLCGVALCQLRTMG